MATTAPRMRQYEHVQRRIELKPSLRVASKRTAPQWHCPDRTLASSTMLPVSPVQMASSPVFAEFVARMSACDMRVQRSPGSRSLSSGAHSRDPLARPGYGASRAPAKKILVVMSGRRVLERPLAENQSSSQPRAAQGETD